MTDRVLESHVVSPSPTPTGPQEQSPRTSSETCPGESFGDRRDRYPLQYYSLLPIGAIIACVCLVVLSSFLVAFLCLVSPLLPAYLWVLYKRRVEAKCFRDYSPVAPDLQEIRLLELFPGGDNDPVECRLIHARLEEKPVYEALSYCWGNPISHDAILVNGRKAQIRLNLFFALRRIRLSDQTRVLWVDALCINQIDDAEKSDQVQKMDTIFKSAKNVIVWLDDSRDNSDIWALTFQRLRELSALKSAELGIELPGIELLPDIGMIKLLRWKLFEAAWWKRIWVIQEVAVAREITVQYGKHSIAWEILAYAIQRSDLRNLLGTPYSLYRFVEWIESMRMSANQPLDLLGLAYEFRDRQVTMGHDKLYALRGISKTSGPTLNVDYAQDEYNLWYGFTKECINTHRSLLVVALVDGVKDRAKVPRLSGSWCLNWKEYGRTQNEERQPFWRGHLGTDKGEHPFQAKYLAAGGLVARCRTDIIEPEVISVQGFINDTITAVGVCVPNSRDDTDEAAWAQTFRNWERLACPSQAGDLLDLKKTFHQTTMAGSWSQLPDDWQYWNNNKLDPDSVSYRRIRAAACKGRRLFTTAGGRIGLGHSRSKVGDSICILLGADIPFIIREQRLSGGLVADFMHMSWKGLLYQDRSNNTRWRHTNCCIPSRHKIIGQAYIADIAQYPGDLGKDITDGRIKLQELFFD